MPAKAPHEAMREAYVHGVTTKDRRIHYPSQKEIAAQFEVSTTTVRNYASAGNWAEERRKARLTLAQEASAKSEAIITEIVATLDSNTAIAANIAIKIIKARIEALEKALIPRSDELEKLSKSLQMYQRIARIACGMPTEAAIVDRQEHKDELYEYLTINELRTLERLSELGEKRKKKAEETGIPFDPKRPHLRVIK